MNEELALPNNLDGLKDIIKNLLDECEATARYTLSDLERATHEAATEWLEEYLSRTDDAPRPRRLGVPDQPKPKQFRSIDDR